MRAIDPAAQAMLDAGVWVQRGLVTLDLPSGVYGLWDGVGNWTWNGITFVGGASLIEVEAVEETSGLASVPLILRLRSIPDTDLSPDVLGSIEAEAYHRRPVTLYTAFFSAEDRSLVSVEVLYRGRIDTLPHRETAEGDAYLEAQLVSMAEDYTRTGTRVRSSRDQDEFAPGDKGFAYVGDVGVLPVYWGGQEPKGIARRNRRNRRRRGNG